MNEIDELLILSGLEPDSDNLILETEIHQEWLEWLKTRK